jgi:glycerol-3-phosphate acyltransferase PlsX
MIRINIDAMGGDQGMDAVIPACVEALMDFPKLSLALYGDKDAIAARLEKTLYDMSRLQVVHAPDVIDNDEAPVPAVRRRKDASVVRALTDLGRGEGDGFVGSGSTGAVLAGATLLVKRLPGIMRPALTPLLPTMQQGQVALIDCGANVDAKPEWLAQFAVMGSVYMQSVLGVKNPRVALLNNGTEAQKGDALVRAAYELIKELPINFVGNVEAREILSGDVDVVVCDGFVGNVALKAIEGTAMMMTALLKQSVMSNTRSKLGGLLLKPALGDFRKRMDYTEHGGAPLLGVGKCVIKAHGSSNTRAFYHAIRQCRQMAEQRIPAVIVAAIAAQGGADASEA